MSAHKCDGAEIREDRQEIGGKVNASLTIAKRPRKTRLAAHAIASWLLLRFDIEFASSSVFGFVRGETLDEWRGVYRVRLPGRADTLSISMCRQTAIVP